MARVVIKRPIVLEKARIKGYTQRHYATQTNACGNSAGKMMSDIDKDLFNYKYGRIMISDYRTSIYWAEMDAAPIIN